MIWVQLCLEQTGETPAIPAHLKASAYLLRPSMLRFANTTRHPLTYTIQGRERTPGQPRRLNCCAKLRR